jgi:hypothetical protein
MVINTSERKHDPFQKKKKEKEKERKHDQSWEKNRNFLLSCTTKIELENRIKDKILYVRTWIIGSNGDFKSSRTSEKKLSNYLVFKFEQKNANFIF